MEGECGGNRGCDLEYAVHQLHQKDGHVTVPNSVRGGWSHLGVFCNESFDGINGKLHLVELGPQLRVLRREPVGFLDPRRQRCDMECKLSIGG